MHTTVAPARMFMQDEYTAQFFPYYLLRGSKAASGRPVSLGTSLGSCTTSDFFKIGKHFKTNHTL